MEETQVPVKNSEPETECLLVNNIPALWQVPSKLASFTGRKQQLRSLVDAIKHQQHHLLIRPTKQITGTGGIGKTQLAVEFAHRAYENHLFTSIFWLNADCTIQDQLNIEFLQFAAVLKIDTKSITKEKMIQEVYHRIAQIGPVLIIFDSASSYETILPYLPPKDSKISIVITTRDDQTWDSSFTPIPVDIFEWQEAVDYIRKVIPDKITSDNQAIELAKTLGRFPLGLAQATGFIKTRNISVETYIELFKAKRENKQKLLDIGQLINDPHAQTIWATVNLCVESVSNELACKLLASAVYLAPELPIHRGLFRHLAKLDAAFPQALDMLRSYSLITNTGDDSHDRIHQLVQEVLQLTYTQVAIRSILEHTSAALEQFFIEEDLAALVIETQRKELLPHMLNMLHHLKNHSEFNEKSMQVVTGPLDYSIGFCYELLGQYDQAISYLTSALERYTAQGHPLRIANAANTLGTTFGKIENRPEELRLLNIAFDLKKELYGENSIELAHIKVNKASNYRACGDYIEAKKLLIESLDAFEAVLPKNHPFIANTMLTLANVYANLGDYLKQKEFANKALEIYRVCYHAEHVQVASARSSLAQACIYFRETVDAQNHLLFVIRIYEKEYGPDHTLTLQSKSNYGNYLLNFTTQNKDVVDIFEHAVSIFQRMYGVQNLQVASCYLNLGVAYGRLDRADAEHNSLHSALSIFRSKLPYNDPKIFRTLQEIARAYGRKKDFKQELTLLKEVLQLKKKFYIGIHLEFAQTYKDLSNCVFDLYQIDKAVKYADKAHRICVQCIGENNPITLDMRDRLLEMQQFKRQYDSSLRQQKEPVSMSNDNLESLGKQCMQKGMHNSALAFFSRATVQGKNIAKLYDQIALCHLQLGDVETARATLIDFPNSSIWQQIETNIEERELLEAQLLSFDDEIETSDPASIIKKAVLLMKLQNFSQAKGLLIRVIELQQDIQFRAPAYYQLALCHFYCQEFTPARECLQKSAKLKAHKNLQTLETQINEAEEFYNQYCRSLL